MNFVSDPLTPAAFGAQGTPEQFTPFDVSAPSLLSDSLSNALSGGDDALLAALLLAATLMVLNMCLGMLGSRSQKAGHLTESRPVLLGRNGKIFINAVQQHQVGERDIHRALRHADCTLQEMRCVFLEADGSITVLRQQTPPAREG
jgi:uncharacterized membrane protein YcaP (DUF421 family)